LECKSLKNKYTLSPANAKLNVAKHFCRDLCRKSTSVRAMNQSRIGCRSPIRTR